MDNLEQKCTTGETANHIKLNAKLQQYAQPWAENHSTLELHHLCQNDNIYVYIVSTISIINCDFTYVNVKSGGRVEVSEVARSISKIARLL